jgi:RND family efflux transporter MFP subunit
VTKPVQAVRPQERPPQSSGKKSWWPRLVLLALIGVGVAWAGFEGVRLLKDRSPTAAEVAAGLPVVRVSPAERASRESVLSLPGDIIAFEDSPVYARVDGYVRQWTVDIGARVKAGQLLAEIETPELDQQLNRARALVLQAKANLEIARITYQRYLGLVKTAAVSQQEVDSNLALQEARKADLTAADAEVDRLTAMKGFQKIYAPFDGIVGARNLAKATTGALIDLGSHDPKAWLYRIYRMDPVRVYVAVPQNYLPMIRDGLAADVGVREYPERTFQGRVVRNAASLDVASRTMLVEVEAPNPDGILLPGMYSTVKFKLVNASPPIVVADSSIIVLADGPQIAVVDRDDVVRIRKVRLGRDFGRTVEILSGCSEGERIVTTPSDLLKDGAKVRVQPARPS